MESGFDHPGDDYGRNHTKQSRKGPKATGEEDHLPSRESADRVAALADNLNHNHIKKEGVFATVAESLTWIHKNG